MRNTRPLGHGDLCVVINGLAGDKSPNLGKFVTIKHRVYGAYGMDHTKHGPIYTCSGKDLVQLTDAGTYINTPEADFPGIWLKRIDPELMKKELEKVLEGDLVE